MDGALVAVGSLLPFQCMCITCTHLKLRPEVHLDNQTLGEQATTVIKNDQSEPAPARAPVEKNLFWVSLNEIQVSIDWVLG
jgi:hypothetical protein